MLGIDTGICAVFKKGCNYTKLRRKYCIIPRVQVY
jgi:hypothetical protein